MTPSHWTKGAVVIGCRQNTLEFVTQLIASGCHVSGIVTLNQKSANEAAVPEWVDLQAAFGKSIPVYVAETYKLSSAQDKSFLSKTAADAGFCIGWQRILPDWFLATSRNGVFGMHTCEHPLPNGRGRSPINWSIIEGADSLHAHIFKYDDRPDNGQLLNVTKFLVQAQDDINTLQQKCRVIFSDVVVKKWDALINATPELFGQDPNQPDRLYPKRSPEDGGIDWNWTSRQITDWVRAQTRPYPGAFSIHYGNEYRIWRCMPTGFTLKDKEIPGKIIEKFADGTYFVQTFDGAVHLIDHDLPKNLEIGTILTCPSSEKKTPTKTLA